MRSWSLSWQRSCRSGKNNRDGDVVGRRSSLDKVALNEGEKLNVHPVGAQQTLEHFVEQRRIDPNYAIEERNTFTSIKNIASIKRNPAMRIFDRIPPKSY